ncbi:hypothetical protein IL306_004776 [Fusarium sp. DS 682]|nr:hypothetical protein IL306_004776 [Fusarium sp. DS 682]
MSSHNRHTIGNCQCSSFPLFPSPTEPDEGVSVSEAPHNQDSIGNCKCICFPLLPSPIKPDEDSSFSKAQMYPVDHTDYEPCRKRIKNTSLGARQVIRFIDHLETHDPAQHDAAMQRLVEMDVDMDALLRLSKRRAEVPWEESWPHNWEKKQGLVLGYIKRNLPRWIAVLKKVEAREAAAALGQTVEAEDPAVDTVADESASADLEENESSCSPLTEAETAGEEPTQVQDKPKDLVRRVTWDIKTDSPASKGEDFHTGGLPNRSTPLRQWAAYYCKVHADKKRAEENST